MAIDVIKTITVDWELNKGIINGLVNLTDSETKEALDALELAKQLYDNLGEETPERIALLGKNKMPLHTIITIDGKACTVQVLTPSSFFEDYKLPILITLTLCGLFIAPMCYYLLY